MSAPTLPLVALSAGGSREELAEVGLGEPHIDALTVRLTRKLLQAGCQVGYGGTLNQPDKDLTQNIIDAAVGWASELSAPEDASERGADSRLEPVGADLPPSDWPVVNWMAWPFHQVKSDYRARVAGVCRFVPIVPDDLGDAQRRWVLQDEAGRPPISPAGQRLWAEALTKMRRDSAAQSDARVVVAGKLRGAKGWLPGIAEEVGASLAVGKPVIILGGFGGCAAALAAFLRDPDAALHPALTFAGAVEDAGYRGLLGDPEDPDVTEYAEGRFTELAEQLERYRERLHSGDPEQTWGLDPGALLRLLDDPNPTSAHLRAVALVEEAVKSQEEGEAKPA